MIIGTIKQQGLTLFTELKHIANQYSENLSLSIDFQDNKFTGYSMLWLYAHDIDMNKTGICEYDVARKELVLPSDAFAKNGYLYISLRGIKENEKLTSSPVAFYIDISGNPEASNTPKEPGWEDIAQGLIEQIVANEYRKPIYDLIAKAQTDIAKFIADGTTDMEELKKSTNVVLEKLKFDYAAYINGITDQYDRDRLAMLEDAAKKIQALKDSTNAAIDTMIKNANTDFKSLKDTTTVDVNNLKKQAQAQQTQIDVSKQSMDTLQADLISKRDSGFFDGTDGALIPTGSGFFTLFKSGGHLKARVLKGSSAPPLIHKNGRLYYRKVKEV